MISIILCVYVVYSQTYVLNPNEVKVFDSYAEGMEKYDLQKSKFVTTIAGSFDDDVIVKFVASQFSPFSSQQRVDLLTTNSQDQYTVYTVTYDKFVLIYNYSQLNKNYNVTNTPLTKVNSCTSIAYLGSQFVVDCSDTHLNFVLQNGTTITYQLSLKFTSIQSYLGGIAAVSSDSMTIFGENLEIEEHYNINFITALVTYENIYFLQAQQISIYVKGDSPQVYQHECKETPQFMTVIERNIYVQCETLKLIQQGYIQTIDDLPDAATSLSATSNYLIVNNKQVYDRYISNLYYTSETAIYPINFADNAITFTNRQIVIGQLVGLYLITETKPQVFDIFDYQFQVVNQGLQALNTTKAHEHYQISNYIAGPDVRAIENGSNVPPIKYNLENSFVQKTLQNAFIYQNTKIVILYSQNSFLNASVCDLVINNVILPKCEPPKIINQKFPSNTKANGIYDSVTDQVVVCYLTANSLAVHIGSETDITYENVVNYDLSEEMLVILYKDSISINYLQTDEYQQNSQFEVVATLVKIHQSEIFLVDSSNNLIFLSDSINGWYKVKQIPISDKILSLQYIQDQLFVITEKVIYVYQNTVPRGTMSLDMTGKKQYLQTDTHFYIYNSSHIYQYQGLQELSFSSLLQQVLTHFNISQLVALSYQKYELIIIDNQLFVYDQVSKFKPNTIVDFDTYTRISTLNVTFNNSFNEMVSQKVKVIGDTLKLEVKDYSSNFEFDENNTLKLDQTQLFSGPISSIAIDDGQQNQISQRIVACDTQPKWLGNLVDLLDLGNKTTVIYNGSTVSVCNQNCTDILNITSCTSFEEDQTSFYLICPKQIYSGTKQNPKTLNSSVFQADKITNRKFYNQSIMAIMTSNGINVNFSLYQNYQLKSTKVFSDLKDFEFNDTYITLLTHNSVITVDFDFKTIHSYDLLKDLIKFEQNPALAHAQFQNILRVNSEQYIISSQNAPTFQLHLHPNSIEVVYMFSNIPNSLPLQIQLQQNTLIVTQSLGGNIYAAFYDLTTKQKHSLIIPYFNVIQLGGRVSINHYTRQFDGEQIVLLNNKLQAYQNNKDIIIKSNSKFSSLTAHDLNIQTATQKLSFSTTEESDNTQHWIIAAYVIAGIVGLALLLIGLRYLRRFCLVRRLKFVEEKGSEFKSEYI